MHLEGRYSHGQYRLLQGQDAGRCDCAVHCSCRREWWQLILNEHGDSNELAVHLATVQVRRHRRETHSVRHDGELRAEEWSADFYVYVKVYRQRC